MRLLPLHLTPSSSLEKLNCHLKTGFLLKRKEETTEVAYILALRTLPFILTRKGTLWQVHLR
jgi:hypothetical protein